MQPLQICIGPIIRIGRESWCLPYAVFFNYISKLSKAYIFFKLMSFAQRISHTTWMKVYLVFDKLDNGYVKFWKTHMKKI